MLPLRHTVLVFHPSTGTTRRIALREKPVEVKPIPTSPLILSWSEPKCVYPLNDRLGKDKLDIESDAVLFRDLQIEVLSRGQHRREYELRVPNVELRLVPDKGDLQFTLQAPDRGDLIADVDHSTEYRIRGFRVSLNVKGVVVDVCTYRDNATPSNLSRPKRSKPTSPKTNE